MREYGHKAVLYLMIVSLVFVIFTQRSCSSQIKQYNATQEVIIPKKIGKFKKAVTIIKETHKRDTITLNGEKVIVENPVNKKLAEDYIKAQKENDSLKTLNLYLEAIGERTETRLFDNKDLKLKVKTKTRGEILDMNVDYEVKERTESVKVKERETKFALYTGASLEYIPEIERITPKVAIGIQNRKGSILSIEAGLDKTVQVGYSFRLINIKK